LRILDISERTARRYIRAINEFISNHQGESLIKVLIIRQVVLNDGD